jgi:hypothetical protein
MGFLVQSPAQLSPRAGHPHPTSANSALSTHGLLGVLPPHSQGQGLNDSPAVYPVLLLNRTTRQPRNGHPADRSVQLDLRKGVGDAPPSRSTPRISPQATTCDHNSRATADTPRERSHYGGLLGYLNEDRIRSDLRDRCLHSLGVSELGIVRQLWHSSQILPSGAMIELVSMPGHSRRTPGRKPDYPRQGECI